MFENIEILIYKTSNFTIAPNIFHSWYQVNWCHAIEMCESLRIHRSEIYQQGFAPSQVFTKIHGVRCRLTFQYIFTCSKPEEIGIVWNKMSRIFVVRSALVFVLFLWYVRWVSGDQCHVVHVDHLESSRIGTIGFQNGFKTEKTSILVL